MRWVREASSVPSTPRTRPTFATCVRGLERYDMHVEAILEPPHDDSEVARFENDVKVAKEAARPSRGR